MPALIDAVETEFTTDFKIVLAAQERVVPALEAEFAESGPGFLMLTAGSKQSRIRLRAERWDDRPPSTDDWEEMDDLPFETVPTAGRLIVQGFDPSGVGLDLGDLGRGRARVLARGRHRYYYGANLDPFAMPPEEWLLQLYPADGPVDPMSGGPRRLVIAGDPSRTARSPWHAAVRGFKTSGWADALGSSHGYSLAETALAAAKASVTRLELASSMVRYMAPWETGGPEAESAPVPPHPRIRDEGDALARISGRAEIATIGDVIDALVSIGLLIGEVRDGRQLLIPNPAPQPVWERWGVVGEQLDSARVRALTYEHRGIANSIESAVRWCGQEGLNTTPRAMAIRWCTTIEDVTGGLRLLRGSGRVASNRDLGFDSELGADESLTLWRGSAPDTRFPRHLP